MASRQYPLTAAELNLKSYLRILFFVYAGGILAYLLPAVGLLPSFLQGFSFLPDPAFANNSVIKMALFAALCFVAAGDVRRHLIAVEAIMVVMFGAVFSGLILILFATNNYRMGAGGPSIKTLLVYSSLFDAVLNGILVVLYKRAQKARYGLHYFSPLQFRTLKALAEVLIEGDKELLSPHQVALNVDRYMSSFLGKTKWISRLAMTGIELYPLLFIKPPTSFMRTEERRAFLEKHFYQRVSLRLAPPLMRMLVQAMIRMGKQLCYMGYYNDKQVHASIGYTPFSARPDRQERFDKMKYTHIKPLQVWSGKDVTGDTIDWDGVVIIGTGPGAAVMAHGLAQRNIPVLMLERGLHTDPADFSEDEIEMVSKLYADGALQLASDFRFQVIQGSAVGGSSVVNNAVCFNTPDAVLDRWNDAGINAGLDLLRFKKSIQYVNHLIGVRQINADPDETMILKEYLNPGGQKFEEGICKLGLQATPNEMDVVAANIRNCVGCGYCNMGCKWGKKLSMLNYILPQVQAKLGSDQFRIIAGCEVEKLEGRAGRITAVRARFADGRKLRVRGRTFVVAAGAISSSILLQRSQIAAGRAGKKLAFNIGSPITAVFPQVINAYDGLQISHYLKFGGGQGYIFETWFNPPMFQSTVMPGWWSEHWKNMHRYNRMACTGVLVGSEATGEVRRGGLTRREVRYQPSKQDFDALLNGLQLAGDIYFEAGAECVMPNSFAYREYASKEALKDLRYHIKDSSDLTIGTGHPQGGNGVSKDPEKGVVDSQLKVHGYHNLFIADASVFPGSVGVNPQITVMAFADYAVPFVADTIGSPGAVKLLTPEVSPV